ncbi:MAG TPA: fumarylacetoacetate hydrolase family protein [Terriglobales bacterium]|nr:fumarylacetoacetate hydrolase family protein [Terriglobales bacterium]
MKYCLFHHNGKPQYGLVESVAGREVITRIFLDTGESPLPDEDARTEKIPHVALEEARLLSPVAPSKIICVGRNYREHATELGNEVPTKILIFSKPPSAVIGHGEAVLRPKLSERVDHEGELGVVIGKRCHKVPDNEDVRPYIHGYTCVNDVTARDLQKQDDQWTRAKGFDTFCPVGPVIESELNPWAGVSVTCRVNGEVRQQGSTKDFIFPIGDVIRYIANVMTLLPGDLIATGTPAGVSALNAGDVVEVEVEGVGTLRNSVADE